MIIKDTLDYIDIFTDSFTPEIGLILGSGLGEIADEYAIHTIPYSKIPGFTKSTIPGHKGNLVFGEIHNKKVVMMQGRNHYYEGHTMQEITYPVKVMKKLGVKNVIITNAAGAVNKSYRPVGERFPDMSEIYDKNLIKRADTASHMLGINLKHGVYLAASGPTYETPAEVKMFRYMGADAVGMSTVPEATVAHYCGMRVLGISCISNFASGISSNKLSHEDVIEITEKVKPQFKELLLLIIKSL